MLPALRRTAFPYFLAACALWPATASADPLVFFLMTAAKEIANSVSRRTPPADPVVPPATTYPGTVVEPETLRRVIDESFGYLTQTQRTEIFESLNEMLLDPKMGPTRATMIEYFLYKALAVRAAQVELARLSDTQKQRLALQFRAETEGLSEEDRKQLLGLLEQRLLPVPADLNQLLLAQLQDPR